jgi:hypothetical protein
MDLITASAYTAGFHFGYIEDGGTGIYPQVAQRVTNPEGLRILLSIGPTETMHFQRGKTRRATPKPVRLR